MLDNTDQTVTLIDVILAQFFPVTRTALQVYQLDKKVQQAVKAAVLGG